jgi:hypothetical protein
MALIVLASDKGSPGVTTTSVALAGVWPRRAILAECDPSGGDLVYRSPAENGGPLNPNIGMLSLATMARHGLSAHQLGDHLQRIHGGLEVVAGLATGDQSAGLVGLWPHLGRAFDALPETDVIADCGRVESGSASLELMAGAALVVLVAQTSAEQIAHVRDRALSLVQRVGGGNALSSGALGVPIGVLLIVDPKQRGRVTAQVDELLRNSGLPVKVIGTIADDPDGADLLNGRGRGRLDKTLLIRSAREVSLDLYRRFAAGGNQGSGSAAAAGAGRPSGAANPGGAAGPVGASPTGASGPGGPGAGPGVNRDADRSARPAPAGDRPNDGRTLNDRNPDERVGQPAGPGHAGPRPNDGRTLNDRDPIPGGMVRPSAPTFDGPTVRTPIPANGFERPTPPTPGRSGITDNQFQGTGPDAAMRPASELGGSGFAGNPFPSGAPGALSRPASDLGAPGFADHPTMSIPVPQFDAPPPFQTAPPFADPGFGANGFDARPVPPAGRPADFDARPGTPGFAADPHHGAPNGFDASSNSFDAATPTGRRALPASGRDTDRADRAPEPVSPWEPAPRHGGHRASPPTEDGR